MKIGTAISMVATPIAVAFGLPCVDQQTKQLRPESTCAQVRDALDQGRYRDAFYDRFWGRSNGKDKEMEEIEYIVTKQISVWAKTPEEAVAKSSNGRPLALSANPRLPVPQGAVQPVAAHGAR